MTPEQVARHLNAKRGQKGKWMAKCPSHDDREASLSIGAGDDGRTLIKCFTGCDLEQILAATGLKKKELFEESAQLLAKPKRNGSANPNANGSGARPKFGTVTATYAYEDSNGTTIFEKQRDGNKNFRIRRPDGHGGWKYGLAAETPRVLYRQQHLADAKIVLLAEGEKDSDGLLRAGLWPDRPRSDIASTTTFDGAAGKWRPEYSPHFSRKDVVIFADNDPSGEAYALRVAESVRLFAHTIKIVRFSELSAKADVSDYLQDHTREDLEVRIADTEYWPPKVEAKHLPQHVLSIRERSETAELLEACRTWIADFMIVSPEQATIVAAWVLHTWVFDAAYNSPYLYITSPEKQCGKTRLLRTLERLVCRPWFTGGVTPATLYRKIDKSRPTLLLDETDAAFGGIQEYTEALRGILNNGYERGGVHSVCVGKGADMDVHDFSCFCPKAIAGIGGRLPDTVASRSITIELRRKLPGETVRRMRSKVVAAAAAPLYQRLQLWASAQMIDVLEVAEPVLPDSLDDRRQDISEPLVAIADVAGGEWPMKLRCALLAVFGSATAEDDSLGAQLLQDIWNVFRQKEAERMASADLATALNNLEGRPWAEWGHGKGLNANKLARQLKRFGIAPRTIRTPSGTPKGYQREQFEDVWTRYCPNRLNIPSESETSPQPVLTA